MPEKPAAANQQEIERLHDELERLRQEIHLLRTMQARAAELMVRDSMVARLSRELNQLDLAEISRICIGPVAHMFGAKVASLYLFDPQQGQLSLLAASHSRELAGRIEILSESHSRRVMAHALREKRALLIHDFDQYDRARGEEFDRPYRDNYSSCSAICAPLFAGSHMVGVLNFSDRENDTPFDEATDGPLIDLLSKLIGIAICNHQLFMEVQQQARTDAMTQLLGHNGFFEQLDRETLRVNRYGGELCLLYLDIDSFKDINDSMGHLTGDHVIREVARILSDNVRIVDVPARYGGDEFACLLPNTMMEGALVIAHRLHERLMAHLFEYEGHQFNITVSMGVAEYQPKTTSKELINTADQALYRAKQSGRNRVCSSEVGAEGGTVE